MTERFNPRYHLDSEQDHHLQGGQPRRKGQSSIDGYYENKFRYGADAVPTRFRRLMRVLARLVAP